MYEGTVSRLSVCEGVLLDSEHKARAMGQLSDLLIYFSPHNCGLGVWF